MAKKKEKKYTHVVDRKDVETLESRKTRPTEDVAVLDNPGLWDDRYEEPSWMDTPIQELDRLHKERGHEFPMSGDDIAKMGDNRLGSDESEDSYGSIMGHSPVSMPKITPRGQRTPLNIPMNWEG